MEKNARSLRPEPPEIDAEWLITYVRDREGRIEHLKLLIASVEADIASREQDRLAAEQTETWLRRLADNLAEVEGDSIEAFARRRELVRLFCYSSRRPPPTATRTDAPAFT